MWITVLLRLQFFIVLLLACCCSSLMNHDVTVSTTLCCRVLTLVCCQPVHGRSGWHLVAQHITWHVVVYVLALGCPTLQSGISLPNTLIWHAVAQHLDLVPGRHMGAQHVFRSTCLYISFELAGRASYRLWSTLWHLLFIRHRLLSGGYMLIHMDILYSVCMLRLNFVYITSTLSTTFHAQEHCCLYVSSLAHLLIRTSPCSIPRLHRLYIICQHQMLCHDITVLHATVLVSNLWSS